MKIFALQKMTLRAISLTYLGAALLGVHPAMAATRSCKAKAQCTLTGKIDVINEGEQSVGVIHTPGGCIAAALPQRIYDHYRRWDGKKVTITGVAHTQPFPPGTISYRLRDRWVGIGACSSDVVIYVDKIKLVR